MGKPARKMFVNLAVEELDRSVDFFAKLGFSFDERFTDESSTCMVVGEDAFVMLLERPRFADFTRKQVVDSTQGTEAILALEAESREAVDEFAEKALANGASAANDPMDMGWMYGRSFDDPDGHLWEVFWMDMAAAEEAMKEEGAAA